VQLERQLAAATESKPMEMNDDNAKLVKVLADVSNPHKSSAIEGRGGGGGGRGGPGPHHFPPATGVGRWIFGLWVLWLSSVHSRVETTLHDKQWR